MDTKAFNEQNFEESRAVCEGIEREDGGGRVVLTDRERQILDMWPKFEDGEYVWFGDEAIDNQGGTRSVVHIGISEHTSCVTDETLLGQYRPTGEPFKRSGQSASDSWERLGADALKGVCEYAGAERKPGTIDAHTCCGCRFDEDGDGPTCEKQMALDLIRRAKALAGVEE